MVSSESIFICDSIIWRVNADCFLSRRFKLFSLSAQDLSILLSVKWLLKETGTARDRGELVVIVTCNKQPS